MIFQAGNVLGSASPFNLKGKKIDTNDSRIQTCTTQMVQYNALTRICWTKEKQFKYI